MDVPARVEAFILRLGLLEPGERVVAAVSGGADSLCLLDCLHHLGYRPIVACFDHRLRPESGEDVAYVSGVARRYTAPFASGGADVRVRAEERGESLEAAARVERYRFLAQTAIEYGARRIATGHTADDQAETVLLHLLRGAGVEGLRGMLPRVTLGWLDDPPEAASLEVVRPLLEVPRFETQAHCRSLGLERREDPTNQDLALLRNRVRHELLPILESYNPRAREVLTRTATILSQVDDLLEAMLEAEWPRLARRAGEGSIALDRARFLRLAPALQMAGLRRCLRSVMPAGAEVDFDRLDRAAAFLRADNPWRQTVGGGVELVRAGQEVLLGAAGDTPALPAYPQLPSDAAVFVPIPGRVPLASGWTLEASSANLSDPVPALWENPIDANTVTLDRKSVGEAELCLRPPIPGDRIRPLGMSGHVKLSDLFINARVPRPARRRWPVLSAGARVLWVAGLRMAECGRLDERSREALVLSLLPPGDG